jgi:plastocyanin
MKLAPIVFASLAVATLGQAPSPPRGGTITGRVVVAKDGKPTATSDVWVYLEEAKPTRSPGSAVTAVISQSDEKFSPNVLLVPVGATVTFPNKDLVEHSVFSPAKGAKWYGFDLGRYAKSKDGKSKRFTQPGEFDVFCDIHMKMWAKVKVVPSRYFAAVDPKDGRFSLRGLPPGAYKVWAWGPQSLDVHSDEVVISGEDTKDVLELHLQAQPRDAVHSRADGSAYPGLYKPPR